MRLLLDECIDRRLTHDIKGHEVKTVPEVGWAGLTNGELLTRAQHDFDAFVTADRNLPSSKTYRASPSPSSCCVRPPIALRIYAA